MEQKPVRCYTPLRPNVVSQWDRGSRTLKRTLKVDKPRLQLCMKTFIASLRLRWDQVNLKGESTSSTG